MVFLYEEKADDGSAVGDKLDSKELEEKAESQWSEVVARNPHSFFNSSKSSRWEVPPAAPVAIFSIASVTRDHTRDPKSR